MGKARFCKEKGKWREVSRRHKGGRSAVAAEEFRQYQFCNFFRKCEYDQNFCGNGVNSYRLLKNAIENRDKTDAEL